MAATSRPSRISWSWSHFQRCESLTITATAGHGTLSFVDTELNPDVPGSTISGTATLAQINTVLADGIVYRPDHPLPGIDNIGVTIADGHGGGETLNLIFNVGGTGGATLTATAGNDVMYGTESGDSFVFDANQNGHDVVANFDPCHDILDFNTAIFDTICEVIDSAHDDIYGNAVITTDHYGTITLAHVAAAQLNSGNIAISGGVVGN